MTNWERLQREAEVTDKNSPEYNSDMDIIVAGTQSTYRDMIKAGFDPNGEANFEAYVLTKAKE